MRRIGLIGLGAIGAAIADLWADQIGPKADLAALLVRNGRVSGAAERVGPGVLVTSSLENFLSAELDAVVEAAGHAAVADYGEAVLLRGCELFVLSAGALADDALHAKLLEAAERGGGRIVVLSGALAGFDGLLSMAAGALTSVHYTSVKPVRAWRQTAAESLLDLDALTAPQAIFSGSAREAAKQFPMNANLAAAVALAGLGFEKTRVELIADPFASENSSRIEAASDGELLDVRMSSVAFEANPKTSRITALSAIAALKKRLAFLRFS